MAGWIQTTLATFIAFPSFCRLLPEDALYLKASIPLSSMGGHEKAEAGKCHVADGKFCLDPTIYELRPQRAQTQILLGNAYHAVLSDTDWIFQKPDGTQMNNKIRRPITLKTVGK